MQISLLGIRFIFAGEISETNLKKFKEEIKRVMNTAEDSMIIYNLMTTRYASREVSGVAKGQELIL